MKPIKNETQSDGASNNTKEDKHALSSINDKSDHSQSVSRRNKHESLQNTYSFPQLPQSKSYANFPAINTKIIKQNNITTGNNSSNIIITSKGSNRQNNQTNVNIAHNSFRKTGQIKIGMGSSKSQENLFVQNNGTQHYKSTNTRSPEPYQKKNTINQIEDYIQQIKVFIPNTGLESEYNPYTSPYSSDQLIKGKTIQMNNIAIFNNYGNKSKSQKRMIHGNSPKKNKYKDYSNNYYYNMMVNEDRQNNKFSPLSLIIKNEPKTVQNKANNIFLKNSRDTD